ncbi:hypothetical protein [Aquibacillus albus]|uniref:Uncharacterized protein n=1 Tax=Aquibacillus albus TaxID=1168171 RepID=A0ABS2N0L9_9BACI|nr:hypothetical protein [Aquibacillus albus]MBM7571684.1 hypothetical protein [Aquibacillus albus]
MNKNKLKSFYSIDDQNFSIDKDNILDLNLKTSYLEQIVENGSAFNSENIIKYGVDFKLDMLDTSKILLKIDKLKAGCLGPEDFKSKKRFDVRKHAYVDKSDSEIRKRGFSPQQSKLLNQLAEIIFYADKLEKAKIHFNNQYSSIPSLSFTIRAKLGQKIGRIAVSFNEIYSVDGCKEEIMVVTILSLRK